MKQNLKQNLKFIFAKWKFNVDALDAMIRVKSGRIQLVNLYIRIKKLIGGKVSKSFIKDLIILFNFLQDLQSKSGNKGLVLYLKATAVCLQQAASGHLLQDLTPLKMRISRTKGSKLPRIISVPHRRIISNREPGWQYLIKFYLTVFYMYRVIYFQPKESLETILQPGIEFDMKYFEIWIDRFLQLFVKDETNRLIPVFLMKMKTRVFTILKSSPLSTEWTWSSHPISLIKAAWAMKASTSWTTFQDLANSYFPRLLVTINRIRGQAPASLGKLGFKEEAAGKLRVFAMVDPFTQWLLYPLHKLIFSILRKIPMDGTFNQLRPVKRLIRFKCKRLYSLDLSAATDRLPVSIQSKILTRLVQEIPGFGDKWAELLVGRSYKYRLPFSKVKGEVYYAVGQPMGALSSWAMLALTHHFIVQVSAWCVGEPITRLYNRYALLGDDIVIGDRHVAMSYLAILKKIGVECGLAKSIISPRGKGLEFAKRTIIEGEDVSPISLKELSVALSDVSNWAAFATKYSMTFAEQANFLGYGYRTNVLSFRKLNHALKVLWLTQIPRVSITSQFFNLANKFPRELEPLLPLFKTTVLKPAASQLLRTLEQLPTISNNIGLELERDEHVQELLDALRIKRPSTKPLIKPVKLDFWGNPVPETIWRNGVLKAVYRETGTPPKDRDLIDCLDPALRKSLSAAYRDAMQPLIVSETNKILVDLKEALKLVNDLSSITSMDQALAAYLKLLRLRATTDIKALLNEKVVRTKSVLPFQARLFRSWSKLTHRLAKLSTDEVTKE